MKIIDFEELDNDTQKRYYTLARLLIESGYLDDDIDELARKIYERRIATL